MWRLQRLSLFAVILYSINSYFYHTSLLDYLCSLTSSRIFTLLFMVFFVDLIYLILQLFLRDLFNYNFSAEYELADHLLGSRYIIIFIFFALNDKSFLQHTFIPTLIFAYLYKFVIDLENLLTCFSSQPNLPSKPVHLNLFMIQMGLFTILFITFCFSLRLLLSTFSTTILTMTELSSEFLVILSTDIIAHILFVRNRPHTNSNTIDSERKVNQLRFFSTIFNDILFLCAAFYRIFISPIQVLANSIIISWGFVQLIIDVLSFMMYKALLKNLGELLKSPESYLQHDNICIICRGVMNLENAKELPCGHCCHHDCLERWFRKQLVCPICQCNLSFLREIGSLKNCSFEYFDRL